MPFKESKGTFKRGSYALTPNDFVPKVSSLDNASRWVEAIHIDVCFLILGWSLSKVANTKTLVRKLHGLFLNLNMT